MAEPRADELGDLVRELAPALALDVTEAFLTRHPEWRTRYGARATTAGVEDANYHLAFLAAALDGEDVSSFVSYARWAARVLAARGIASTFLAENLEQLRAALAARLAGERTTAFAPYFDAAVSALAREPDLPSRPTLTLTTEVFLQAILTGQRHAAVQVAREALRGGLTLKEVYVDVFQPALYEVGARWEANRLTVAQEHIATAITQYVMAQVYEAPDLREEQKGQVVLTGVQGELHNIGAVMVGDLLEMSGWNVRFLGTNLPAASILSLLRETNPTHVGISATMLFNVGAVRELIQAIRSEFREHITILVGGAAFRTNPELWRQVSADAFASDLRGVSALFEGAR